MNFLKKLSCIALATTSATTTGAKIAFATSQDDAYIDSLKVLFMSEKLIEPIYDFTLAQKYDQARSNVRYTTDILQLQKKMTFLIKNSLDYVDDPEIIDSCSTIADSIGNTAVQVDGTIYALAFLPGDDTGVLPPSAQKYINETKDYVKRYYDAIQELKKLGNEQQLTAAKSKATDELKKVPEKFFKK